MLSMMISVTFLEQRTEITKITNAFVMNLFPPQHHPPTSYVKQMKDQTLSFFIVGVGMAALGCQLDYTWIKLRPKWQGTPVRDIFVPN